MYSWKKLLLFLAIVIAAAALLSACGDKDNLDLQKDLDELTDENKELQDEISDLKQQLDNVPSEAAEAEQALEYKYAIGINCMLYSSGEGESSAAETIQFTDAATISAIAVTAPEGMILDHFNVNGTAAGSELTIDITATTVIEAVFREQLKVTSVNAYIQLLDAGGAPSGEKLYEYTFENEQDKTVSIYVRAEVPSNYQVDHWLIDGVPYYFSSSVGYFKVFDLNRTISYEAVFTKSAQTQTPAPATQMVNVSCTNATFSGGGYSGATSGQVPKGTTITVTGTVDLGSPNYWIINGANNSSYGKSFSYTVNGNTSFQYTGYN